MQDPFSNAMTQLDKVASIKKFSEDVISILRQPNRDIKVSIPIRMDDGTLKIFEGYRVEYNNALGPYKGGIRYHQSTNISEVKALAFWMSLKCAVIGIPMGGSKGGITVDPKLLSRTELEKLSRGWIQKLSDVLGPYKDVPAPDLNTTAEIMGWMSDEYSQITGDKTGAVITGKPVEKGGSLGRDTATAQGGYYALEALKAKLGLNEKYDVAIQGFGNAGANAAKVWKDAGHKIVAIADSKGGVFNQDGLDVEKLMRYKKDTGAVSGFTQNGIVCKSITNEELLGTDCDLLIPAAFENVITEKNANNIKAKVILELANGPVTPKADSILFNKNIVVIPDILANAGGVAVSYFEWDQNLKNEHWTKSEVFAKLQQMMATSAKKVFETAKSSNTDLRMGAFIMAIESIEQNL